MAEYDYEEDPGVVPTGRYYQPEPVEEDDTIPTYARPTSGEGPPPVISAEEYRRSFAPPAPRVAAPVTDDTGPPLVMTPDEFFTGPGTATRTGAFLRGAAEGALPGVAGLGGGVLAGAGVGAAMSGPLAPAGALVGGVLGGLATGYGAAKLQDWVLDALGMREGSGPMSRRQRQTDEALFPYSRFAGEMVPAAAMLRPGGTLLERGISGVIGGGAAAAADYYETGEVDPVKAAMGAVAGAALPNLNRPAQQAINRITPRAWRPPEPRVPGEPRDYGTEIGPRQPYGGPIGPEQPQPFGPRAPSELENMVSATRAQRDSIDPLVDPDLYRYWSWHHNILNERLNSSRAGNADIETQASQGPGIPSTPRGTDLANDVTTVSPGVAAENRPVYRPEAGNPTGAPMFNREAARPSAAERNYGKDAVPDYPGVVTQPSTPVSTDPIAADIRAALGGWETTRTTAPARAVEGALARGVADVNRPPAAPAAAPEAPVPGMPSQPAPVRSWNEVRADMARARAPQQPQPAAPEPPPTAPAADIQTTAKSFVDKLVGQTGGNAGSAHTILENLLRDNPTFRKDPVMVHALALLQARVPVAAPVTPTAPTAAGRSAPVPAAAPDTAAVQKATVPAADLVGRAGPSPEAADLASKILTQNGNNPAEALRAVAAMVKQVPQLRSNPHVAEAHGMLKRMAAGVPKSPVPPSPVPPSPVPPSATQAAIAKSKAAVPPVTRASKATAAPAQPAPVPKLPPAAQAAVEGRKPARPASRETVHAPSGAIPPNVRALVERNRARLAADKEKVAARDVARQGATAPVTKDVAPVTKPEGAPPQPPPAAKAAIAKSKKKAAPPPKAPAADPLAGMSEPAQKAMAKLEGIDTNQPDWKDRLVTFWKDQSGAIDIGPADFRTDRAKTLIATFAERGVRLVDQPGTTISGLMTMLSRGSPSWARQTLDTLFARHPELTKRPNLREAYADLAESSATETPTTVAGEVDIPGPKPPRERVPEETERVLPKLPTHTIMQQKDPAGNVVREAPFRVGLMDLWRRQMPDHPVVMRETNVKRPSTPRYEEPEVPPERPRAVTGTAGEAPPPGERTPRMVIDPVTGEPRETKIWRSEEAVTAEKPAEPVGADAYDMELTGKLLRVLPEAQQTKLIEQMQASTPAEYNAAAKQLWDNHMRFAQTRNRLSTGALVQGEADRAHKQAVLDANERAYKAHPAPEGQETNEQTRARATAMVTAAEKDIAAQITELKKLHPEFKEFSGQYTPKDKPAGTAMLMAARQLLRDRNLKKFRSSEALIGQGTDPSTGAKLVRETENIGGGIAKQSYQEAADTAAPAGSGRPEYEATNPADSPDVAEQRQILSETLNGMDQPTHDLLYDTWEVPLEFEVATTKTPAKLLTQIIEHLSDIARQKNEVALSMREPAERTTPTKRYKYEGPLSKEEVEEITGRPQRYYRRTEEGSKASEARTMEPGSLEFVQTAEEALAKFGAAKRAPLEPGAVELKPTRRDELLRTANELGIENVRGSNVDLQKRILQYTKKIASDEGGSLDVTGIFNFIDKFAKKFRPDREPMVPTGMTRLYKADGEAKWSPEKTGSKEYVDVPTSAIEQVRVDGVSGATGKAADRFAKKWDKTFDLDNAAPDRRVPVEPEDLSLTDHLRRLWHDENGALDIGKLPQWVPNARNKLRDLFSPKADPAVLDYGRQIGEDNVVMRNRITRGKRDWEYQMREAVMPDTKEPPTWVERGQMLRAFEDRKMVSLPPRLRDYWDKHIQPRLDEALDVYKDVRATMTKNEFPGYKDMPDPVDNGADYAPYMFRRRKKEFETKDEFDPLLSRNTLALWSPSTEAREWFAFQQDGTKARRIYHVNKEGDVVVYKDGRVIDKIRAASMPEGFDPRQVGARRDDMVVDNAKTHEIMAHGNEEVTVNGKTTIQKPRYMEDPLLVISDAYEGLLRMREHAKFIERMVHDPKYVEMSAPNKTQAEKKWGEGNVKETILPHFKGKWFPKPVAWAFDDAVKMGFDYNGSRFMEGLARFNQAAMKPFLFLGPQVHVNNELDKFLVGRGYENLNLPKTFRHFGEAIRSVRNQDGLQTEIMEAGGNPMFAHSMVSRFVPNMARLLKSDFQERPWKYDPIRLAFGYDIKPKWEHIYQASNKFMWWQSDVLYTALYNDMKQRHGGKDYKAKYAELEKLQKIEKPTADQVKRRDELDTWNKDLAKKAVHETEKIIDSYIVPTTFGKTIGLEGTDAGRALQKFLTDPATANFGRFSYGLYKTIANVAKNMVGKNENMSAPASMALGFSQAAMLLLMANVVYPYLSKAYQQMPWAKPDSEFEKRGATAVATIPTEIAHKGLKDGWSKFARRIWSPAIAPNIAMTAYENRDNVGRPIIESSGGWGKVPGQIAEHALGQVFSPGGQFSRAAAQGGADFAVLRFLESNFGVKTPSDAQTRYEARREAEQNRLAKSRERHPRGALEAGGNYLSNTLRKAVRGYEHGGVVPMLPGR